MTPSSRTTDDAEPAHGGMAAAVASERRRTAAVAALFLAVAVATGADVAGDLGQGAGAAHVATEAFVVIAGLAGAGWMAWRLVADARRLREKARGLVAELAESRVALERSRADADRWRSDASNLILGLGAAIDEQFERWGLSEAEKEVALLLLKGLSHKEAASVRGTSEATTRQQARAVYRKADLEGRRDLAAFFLEDLLAPRSRACQPPPGSDPGGRAPAAESWAAPEPPPGRGAAFTRRRTDGPA